MRVTPISEEEAATQSGDLWPNGEYDYEIRDASEETSAAGNEMIKLGVWIYDKSGGRRFVFDYLVGSDKAAWKVRHFAASCGLLEQYETGSLMVAEVTGRTGRCTLGTQKATGEYPAKNIIRDYVAAADAPARASAPPARAKGPKWEVPAGVGTDLDDEIPF